MEDDFFAFADAILGNEERGKTLRRTSGGFEAPSYNPNIDRIEEASAAMELSPREAILLEIKAIAHSGQWDTLVFFAPMGSKFGVYNSADYINTTLHALSPNGRLIITMTSSMLVTSNSNSVELRQRILETCHLNRIIKLPDRNADMRGVYLVDLSMGRPSDSVEFYVFDEDESFADSLRRVRNGELSFTVNAKDMHERWDPGFLDPKFKDARRARDSKNTVKLGDLAEVFSGVPFHYLERKDEGKYLVLMPRLIWNGEIRYDDERICYTDVPKEGIRFRKAILQNGDIIVANTGKIRFAKYNRSDKKVIAEQNICIIRPKPEYRELVGLYFGTKLGEDSFNTQAEMLSFGFMNRVTAGDLRTFVIPDTKTLALAARLQESKDLEDRVAMLFESEGWNVTRQYRHSGDPSITADIALMDGEQLIGIVETKRYDSNSSEAIAQLALAANEWRKQGARLFILFIGDKMYRYESDGVYRIPDVPKPSDYEDGRTVSIEYRPDPLNNAIKEVPKEQTSPASDYAVLSALEDLTALAIEIRDKVNVISAQLQELASRINDYQDLVGRQLRYASDNNEMQECILRAFTDTCVERITASMRANSSEELYADEERRLIESIGRPAWDKLGDDAKRFLISSKYMYAKLADVEDIVDYSGVCLLVTKSLELELGKRFCVGYINYYKAAHPGRAGRASAPLPIMNRYRSRFIKPEDFTLGSFPYIIGDRFAGGLSDSEQQIIRDGILEYVKQGVLKSYCACHDDDEALDLLHGFAEDVDRVREDFRNPSAHTNALSRVSAKECFDLVLDVEKLLKRMLEAFDD